MLPVYTTHWIANLVRLLKYEIGVRPVAGISFPAEQNFKYSTFIIHTFMYYAKQIDLLVNTC